MKLKDKKIQILKQTIIKDPEGFSTKIWEPIHEGMLWAYFRQLSGKEIYRGGTTVATEQVQFVINYRPDVSTAHVVSYRGVLYDVTRVDTFEGHREDLTLYARVRM